MTRRDECGIINTVRETALAVPAGFGFIRITAPCGKLKGGYFFICFISSISNAIKTMVKTESK